MEGDLPRALDRFSMFCGWEELNHNDPVRFSRVRIVYRKRDHALTETKRILVLLVNLFQRFLRCSSGCIAFAE